MSGFVKGREEKQKGVLVSSALSVEGTWRYVSSLIIREFSIGSGVY